MGPERNEANVGSRVWKLLRILFSAVGSFLIEDHGRVSDFLLFDLEFKDFEIYLGRRTFQPLFRKFLTRLQRRDYGLIRYAAASIKSYTKEDDGLCHNYVRGLSEDGNGNL